MEPKNGYFDRSDGVLDMVLKPYLDRLANPNLDVKEAKELLLLFPEEVQKHPAWDLWVLEDPSLVDVLAHVISNVHKNADFIFFKENINNQSVILPLDTFVSYVEAGGETSDAIDAFSYAMFYRKAPIK